MATEENIMEYVKRLEKEKIQQMSDAHQEDGEESGVDPSRVMGNIEKLDHLNKQVGQIKIDQVKLIDAIEKDTARLDKLGQRAIAEARAHLDEGPREIG